MANNRGNKQIKLILDLLKQGTESLKIDTHNDAVLVLGNTGSGKSTFTYFIAGNNDNLESTEVGSGEYIIIDKKDKISNNSTITSKTILPELVTDIKTKTAFYDCPGFSDTRSAAHDISGTYFIKKIIDSTSSIKLVFTISHPSVRHGVDRQNFMLLVKHATTMIKNIEKFKDSMALVVTKVDNTLQKQGKNYILVADDKVIEDIANFMKGVEQELKAKIELADISLQEQHFYKNAVLFIDALLTHHDQHYTKIGIFRRPDEDGVLSNIALLQDGKKSLEKIIFENIHFVAHDGGDFSYTISSQSKIHVLSLVEEINKCITSDMKNVGQEIAEYYRAQEKQCHDIDKLYSKFKSGYDVLLETKTSISKFEEPRKFITQIIKNLNNLNINISSKNLLSVLNYEQYLKFLQAVSDQETSRPTEWARGLINVIAYLDDSKKWYSFLVNSYIVLSKYNIQQDINKYNITSLKNQINTNRMKGVKITEINLKEFLNQVNEQELDIAYHNVKGITVDQFKLKALGRVLELTLNHRVNSLCLSNKLVMRGQYVKLSDVINKTCTEKIKFIDIFALNKVFIDTNINKTGDKAQLSIIAPIWDIIGSQKIILDGKPGEDHMEGKAIGPGKDGKPGIPGGLAGNFFGIEQEFSNGQHLSISANGGKGGTGQNGSDGASGKNGEDLQLEEHVETGKDGLNGNLFPSISEQVILWEKKGFVVGRQLTGCFISHRASFIQWCQYGYTLHVYSKNCTDGKNGGDGGIAGKGGNAGDIIIVKPNNDLKISSSSSQGKTGTNGHGGNGGIRGETNGQLLVINGMIKESETILGLNTIFIKYDVESRKSFPCNSGNAGITGNNKVGMQKPEEAVKFLNPSQTVNDYKSYLRENLSGSIRESSIRKFLNQLENDHRVKELYDTLGFVNELQSLEHQYHKLHKEMSLLPFYKSLQHRISQYADNPKVYERSTEYKKALSYTYTATLSKICSMNNNLENSMVINLNEYLDLIINNIKKLDDISSVVVIKRYQTNYQKVIASKTNEAEQFISTQITPEIDNIFNQIENKILLLVDETITLQNATREEEKKLKEQKQELENSLKLRKLLGTVKIASQFLSFLGPVGAGAGAAIGGGIMVTESLALDDISTQGNNRILALPSAVKNSVTKITDHLKNKQQLFKLQLHDAQQALEKFLGEQSSSNIREIKSRILDTKARYENEIQQGAILDPASTDKMHNMRKELVELLGNKKEALEKQKLQKDANIDKQLIVINHVQNIVSIGEMSIDFYSRIRNHQSKIDKLGAAIKKEQTKMIQLEQYEQNIYKIILPVCRDIENSVITMNKKLQGKSHVALDISKWQIQSAIKDMKVQMQKMSKGFNVQEDLIRLIEKLEEGMSILINVYDRIEDYVDKAELAAYISDINSSKAMKLNVENVELNNAINELALIIKSNLILGQYENAMKAFKQYIFPFAHSYLEEFNSPSSVKLDDDINNSLLNAVTQIEHVKSKISESTASINTYYDGYIYNNVTFKSSQGSPFFIWQHDTNKATILKLLEGQEVTIKADIMRGFNKNAVKFNVIGIRFKVANETLQNELDKQLQHFDVTMTHLGISYYRCGNQFYTITNDRLVISYSLNAGEPFRTNLVYDKIKNNDYVLSPYAMWNIKLTNVSGSFDTLAKYKNQVIDLELEGRGQYIDQGIDVCNQNLENYYKIDDTISEINDISIDRQQDSIIFRHDGHLAEESHPRRRRDIMGEQYFFSTDIDKDSHVTSGICSNFKSSYINHIFNIISDSLMTPKYLNPVKKITGWLVKDEKKVDSDVMNNSSMRMKLINIPPLPAESLDISNTFIDKDSSVKEEADYTLLHNHGNLLLLDLLMRKKRGVKYNVSSVTVNHDLIDNEYAHKLAYSAYAPKDKVAYNNINFEDNC